MRICIFIILIFLPDTAFANSMAPIFPVISVFGWLAMPVIVALEAFYYSRKSVNNPVRLSLYANMSSALVGLVLAVITFPVMLGPPVDPYLPVIVAGAAATAIGLSIHWWLSSFIEYKFSRWHKLWKDCEIPLNIFFKANGITYGLTLLFFVSGFIMMAMQYFEKT